MLVITANRDYYHANHCADYTAKKERGDKHDEKVANCMIAHLGKGNMERLTMPKAYVHVRIPGIDLASLSGVGSR